MQPRRNSGLIYGLLLGVWVLIVAWQVEEHIRVRESAQNSLRRRSQAIADTIGAVVRGQSFRGAALRERLDPVLKELVDGDTNSVESGEVISIELLGNAATNVLASAGKPIDLEQADIRQAGEHWGTHSMTRVYPVEGAYLTNTLIFEIPTNAMRFGRPGPPADQAGANDSATNTSATNGMATRRGEFPPPPDGRNGRGFGPPPGDRPGPRREGEFRRPFWARGMSEEQYQEITQTHELHGVALTLSTQSLEANISRDFWQRIIIVFFAGISAAGAGMAMRNVSKTSDLQIRLVRASELNSHLKEMNLAAAGLAHETRNPLNIIRGIAQMLSKQTDAPTEIREKTRVIMDETDKVTAQLTEFINYSRPREVRRSKVVLNSAFAEVQRTLNHDLEEKKVRVETTGDPLTVEADDQLLRQVLFNLLINAIQAVGEGGQIQIHVQREDAAEASLEIRDNGPGVSPEQRQEIFKPYFTTHQRGTGLGLAIVQQIILAHGWEIQCLANTPKGAVFRITHLKVAA
ncbi:MAG TPA: ATP-binding protein [Verrucomicrobiae bacterium]|nr:ATP-binding protein [Verrucomicrobiae bacterium]